MSKKKALLRIVGHSESGSDAAKVKVYLIQPARVRLRVVDGRTGSSRVVVKSRRLPRGLSELWIRDLKPGSYRVVVDAKAHKRRPECKKTEIVVGNRVAAGIRGGAVPAASPGPAGRDGVDGRHGADGRHGNDGRDGINGGPGRNGSNGRDGATVNAEFLARAEAAADVAVRAQLETQRATERTVIERAAEASVDSEALRMAKEALARVADLESFLSGQVAEVSELIEQAGVDLNRHVDQPDGAVDAAPSTPVRRGAGEGGGGEMVEVVSGSDLDKGKEEALPRGFASLPFNSVMRTPVRRSASLGSVDQEADQFPEGMNHAQVVAGVIVLQGLINSHDRKLESLRRLAGNKVQMSPHLMTPGFPPPPQPETPSKSKWRPVLTPSKVPPPPPPPPPPVRSETPPRETPKQGRTLKFTAEDTAKK